MTTLAETQHPNVANATPSIASAKVEFPTRPQLEAAVKAAKKTIVDLKEGRNGDLLSKKKTGRKKSATSASLPALRPVSPDLTVHGTERKSNAGRKKLPEGEVRDSLTIRLTADERKLIETAAGRDQMNVTAWVRIGAVNLARQAVGENIKEFIEKMAELSGLLDARTVPAIFDNESTRDVDPILLGSAADQDSDSSGDSSGGEIPPTELTARAKRKYTRKPKPEQVSSVPNDPPENLEPQNGTANDDHHASSQPEPESEQRSEQSAWPPADAGETPIPGPTTAGDSEAIAIDPAAGTKVETDDTEGFNLFAEAVETAIAGR